jgi:dTDP-4-amino-4,6-dideoxygalactose transaminase
MRFTDPAYQIRLPQMSASTRMRAGRTLEVPVGGFFSLHNFSAGRHSVFDHWNLARTGTLLFGNARSALAHLLNERAAKRIWLPAYICEAAAEGAQQGAASVAYYPVDDALAPDTAYLDRSLRRGDFVLAVDYFGRTPSASFRELVATRRDIGWIEDRAQALDVKSAWGTWQLFSPRKLLGVPDGGALVARTPRTRARPLRLAPPRIARMLDAQVGRLESAGRRSLERAYSAYRRSEASQRVARMAMSQLTLSILRAVDALSLARARRENWRTLHARLGALAAWPGAPGPAPYGYVIRVADAARLQARLARRGVFAQRHWARLPSPRPRYPDVHRLAQQLLTLPCDHRYDAATMRAVARVVQECAR